MKLSAEQFAELAASFNTADSSCDTQERRRTPRIELPARVQIIPIVSGRQGQPLFVDVCDFSARGLAFIHPTPMNVGEQFITEFPRQSGGRVQLLCIVANARDTGHGAHRIGAEFTCALQPGSSGCAQSDGVADMREMQRIRRSLLG